MLRIPRGVTLVWLLTLIMVFAVACSSTPEPSPTSTADGQPRGEQTPGASGETTEPSVSPTPTPKTILTIRLGIIEVRVTDQPSPDVTAIVITVDSIEVNKSGGDTESGWTTVIEEETSFDLLAVAGVEEVLGSAELEVGSYPQIRLHVQSVVVSFNDGTELEADVPSDIIRIVGPIVVEEGQATIATFDFDAGKSLVFTGIDKVLFKPVVKLLVRDSSDPFVPEQAQAEASDPTATPEPFDEFFLSIESPASTEVITTDSSILIVGRTRVDAVVSVGSVFADIDEDGRFEVPITLAEGPNTIDIVASVESGEELVEIIFVLYTP